MLPFLKLTRQSFFIFFGIKFIFYENISMHDNNKNYFTEIIIAILPKVENFANVHLINVKEHRIDVN